MLAESAALLKHGHMAIAKVVDMEPLAPSSARGLPPTKPRQPESWRCTGSQRQAPLYRDPALPICLGELPNGTTVSVQRYRDDTRDWRKLSPTEVRQRFADMEAKAQIPQYRLYPTGHRRDTEATRHFEGLMAAIAVGTLQAYNEGLYWAPSFQDRDAHQCKEVRSPMSRAFVDVPDVSAMEPRFQGVPQIVATADRSPLAACQELALRADRGRRPRVALVRLVPLTDAHNACPPLGDYRQSQLYLRTTFLQALQEMPRHLHSDPGAALHAGNVIYTTDVTILRGPLEAGAEWLHDAPRIDVISVALQRHPRCDDQGQYARIGEKAMVAKTMDRLFACAAGHDVDVLVFPPLGIGGVAGCHHPAADSGDLLRKAILAHGSQISEVHVCQEHTAQLHGSMWATFASSLEQGRTPIEHRELVPLVASPYLRPGWSEKTSSLASALATMRSCSSKRTTPRSVKLDSKLGSSMSSRGEAVLGSAGRAIVC